MSTDPWQHITTSLKGGKYRLTKAWQCRGEFIEISSQHLLRTEEEAKQRIKGILHLEWSAKSMAITLKEKRSERGEAKGIIADQWRRLQPVSTTGLYFLPDQKHWVMPMLSQQGKPLYLWCDLKNDLRITLIEENTIVGAMDRKGSYTKKHSAEEFYRILAGIQEQNLDDHLATLFAQWTTSEEIVETKTPQLPGGPEELQTPQEIKNAQAKIKRRLKTLEKALSKERTQLPSDEDCLAAQILAHRFQSHAHLLCQENEVVFIQGEPEHAIPYDPHSSLGQHVSLAFAAAKKLKLRQEHTSKLLHNIQGDLDQLRSLQTALRSQTQVSEVQHAQLGKLGIQRQAQPAPRQGQSVQTESKDRPSFRAFQLGPQRICLVGRSPRENDLLTKGAKGNDTWLHVVQGGGSHVVIPFAKEDRPHGVPPELLRKAAILATHFSKQRKSMSAEVYYTTKQHLKKPKGAPPGYWTVLKADSLLVRYSEEECRTLLDQMRN